MKRVTLLVAGFLAACSSVPKATHISVLNGSDRGWVLKTLQGERLPDRIATVRLMPDHSVTGTSACNDLGPGKLQWSGTEGERRGTINADGAGAGIVTVVGCGNTAAVIAANRFWRLMDSARTWSLDRSGLSIGFADGSEARFVAAKPRVGPLLNFLPKMGSVPVGGEMIL